MWVSARQWLPIPGFCLFSLRSAIVFLFILCWAYFSSLAFSWSSHASGASRSPWKGCCPSRVFWVLSFLLFMVLTCLTIHRVVIEARVPGTYLPCLGLSTDQPSCRILPAHVPACGWCSLQFLTLEERTATAFVFILLSKLLSFLQG